MVDVNWNFLFQESIFRGYVTGSRYVLRKRLPLYSCSGDGIETIKGRAWILGGQEVFFKSVPHCSSKKEEAESTWHVTNVVSMRGMLPNVGHETHELVPGFTKPSGTTLKWMNLQEILVGFMTSCDFIWFQPIFEKYTPKDPGKNKNLYNSKSLFGIILSYLAPTFDGRNPASVQNLMNKWMKQCIVLHFFSSGFFAGILKHQQYDVRYELQKPPSSITRVWAVAATRPGLLAHSPTPSSLSAFASLGVAWWDSTETQNPGKIIVQWDHFSAAKNVKKYRFQKHNASNSHFKAQFKKKAAPQKDFFSKTHIFMGDLLVSTRVFHRCFSKRNCHVWRFCWITISLLVLKGRQSKMRWPWAASSAEGANVAAAIHCSHRRIQIICMREKPLKQSLLEQRKFPLPFKELTYPLPLALLNMIFLFPRWYVLGPWIVYHPLYWLENIRCGISIIPTKQEWFNSLF